MAARRILRTSDRRRLGAGSWESRPPTAGRRFCPDQDAAATRRPISPGRCPPGGHIRHSIRVGRRASVMTARIWLQLCVCGRSSGPALRRGQACTHTWAESTAPGGSATDSSRIRPPPGQAIGPQAGSVGLALLMGSNDLASRRPRHGRPKAHPRGQNADRPRHGPSAPRNCPGPYLGELRLGPGTMPAGPPETDQGLIRVSRLCATDGLRRSGEDRRRPRESR